MKERSVFVSEGGKVNEIKRNKENIQRNSMMDRYRERDIEIVPIQVPENISRNFSTP